MRVIERFFEAFCNQKTMSSEKYKGIGPICFITLIAISTCLVTGDINSSAIGYSLKLYNSINSFRAKHTIPALRWDRTLTEAADNFAVRILTESNSFDIEDSEGINFFMIPGITRPPALFVAEVWYNESSLYDFNKSVYNPLTLNYTQMIWKSSTSVGVGTYIDTENNYTSVVAKFFPAGNVKGKFKQNVIPIYKRM